MRWWVFTTTIFVFLSAGVKALDAAEPITVSVQSVNSKYDRSITTTTAGMMTYEETVVPLTSYADSPSSELDRRPDDPTVRVLLALPNQLLLVQLEVTIDGQPFPSVRSNRVQKLVADETQESWPDQLRKYVESTQRDITAKEAGWLLHQWGNGTPLMLLSENFERSRASQSPVRDVLDRNADSVIDVQEYSDSVGVLRRCDTNQNGVVELEEIQKAASSMVAKKNVWSPPELMIPIRSYASLGHSVQRLTAYAKQQSADSLLKSLSRFDQNSDGRISVEEFDSLMATPIDMRIKIGFKEGAGQATISGEANTTWKRQQSMVSTQFAGAEIQFAAVTSGSSSDQISIGIVSDGYPIAPLLDQNEDGRLTERELRQIPDRLAILDQNNDRQLTKDELKPVVRFAVGYGLCVQDYLGTVRSVVQPNESESTPRKPAPDWFATLDKNNDGDLNAKEFVGTKEQFQKLDKDKDGLISVEEAGE